MNFILHPWQLLIVVLAGWINSEQQKIIDFNRSQLEAVMQAEGKKRHLLTDGQRRILVVKGKSPGRKTLTELSTIVTPDTILWWHRLLIAKKWDYTDRRERRRASRRHVEVLLPKSWLTFRNAAFLQCLAR